MSTRVSNQNLKPPAYSAPNLAVYGVVSQLTASGSKSSLESNGGTCLDGNNNKNRC